MEQFLVLMLILLGGGVLGSIVAQLINWGREDRCRQDIWVAGSYFAVLATLMIYVLHLPWIFEIPGVIFTVMIATQILRWSRTRNLEEESPKEDKPNSPK